MTPESVGFMTIYILIVLPWIMVNQQLQMWGLRFRL